MTSSILRALLRTILICCVALLVAGFPSAGSAREDSSTEKKPAKAESAPQKKEKAARNPGGAGQSAAKAPASAPANAPSASAPSTDSSAKPPTGATGSPKPQAAAPAASSAKTPPALPPPVSGRAPSAKSTHQSANKEAESHALRLRDLESRIDELKEQIRRSHTRLTLLSETLLSGGLGGARADISFHNEMSNAFRIIRVLVIVDGQVQYKKEDKSGQLSTQKDIPVFNGPIPPGDHTMQVVVGMQGHGYGVFSYLRAFKPEVRHTRSFTVEEGKAIRLEITAWEKGGATTPLEQRPALRITEKIMTRREAELSETE